MPYTDNLTTARTALKAAMTDLSDELRTYPTPVSGCDAQYNHLIGTRNAIGQALRALDAPPFVATRRTPTPSSGVESR